MFDPCEMAGGNVFGAELPGAIDEIAKLEALVADDAWVRRAASFVFFGEVIDDLLLEIRGLIDEIVRDAEFVRDRPGVHDRLRSTALVFGARNTILRPKLQGDADDVVALLEQKARGSGGVDSSTQANDNASFLIGHK